MAHKIERPPVQRGGVQTPKIGLFESWRLWWKHRALLSKLNQGDVSLNYIQMGRSRGAVFKMMGELTSASGKEIALLRTSSASRVRGLVVRLGKPGRIPDIRGAIRVIAHTHTNGMIGLSAEDYGSIFLNPSRGIAGRGQRSTIIVSPSGLWRRFGSNQEILGGNFP